MNKRKQLTLIFICIELAVSPAFALNYHGVGWFNTPVPGGGRYLMGEQTQAWIEAGYETIPTVVGFDMSDHENLSLDGFRADQPTSLGRRYKREASDISRQLTGTILMEWGIKSHMVNVFRSYRDAARLEGVTEDIDQSEVQDLFLSPFQSKYLLDPWVFIPILGVLTYVSVDYRSSLQAPETVDRLTPTSNALYDFQYGVWQPFGSGAPEEMFYRGFLQRELYQVVPSPFFSVPIQALAFSLSHEPGEGRVTALLAGAILGTIAHINKMDLHKGIALHFWCEVILGLQSILLSHDNQGNSPPGGFTVQVDF